jgi:phospholipase/lecithinase/hemolysin
LRIDEWNAKLPELAEVFKRAHPGVAIAIYNAHALFTKVLDKPDEYGFKDAFSIGDSDDKCIWKDELHPTSAMHKVLAADIAEFLTGLEQVAV